ncbi:MAG TPA: OmpA family protein [Steroidobacteraceae bacterium]|nr:OmpA family protein [Steroidobacteraceae bacterium]
MSDNLLDALSDLMTPSLLGRAAGELGEPETAVSKGMGAVFPLMLGGLASRADDRDFVSSLFALVTDKDNDPGILDDVGRLLGAGASSLPIMALGGKFLNLLFGNRTDNVAGAVGNYAGVKPSAASSMLRFASPLLLGMLGRTVKRKALNAAGLGGLLLGEKDKYKASLPGPLARLDDYIAGPARPAHVAPPPAPEKKSSIWRWLLPLLVILGVLWLLSRCMGPKEEPVTMTPAPAPAVEPAPVVEPAPMPMPEAPASAYVFFEVDKAELPATAGAELAGTIEYMLANPSSRANIAGYHDPTGDKAYNEDLAKNRALAVRDALVAAGISEDRLDLDKPIETTGTGSLDEARRVEVRIIP